MIYYRPQRSLRRLWFYTCLSVILFTEAGVPGQVPPGQVHPPTPAMHAGIRSTSERYASYWNVITLSSNNTILFNNFLIMEHYKRAIHTMRLSLQFLSQQVGWFRIQSKCSQWYYVNGAFSLYNVMKPKLHQLHLLIGFIAANAGYGHYRTGAASLDTYACALTRDAT